MKLALPSDADTSSFHCSQKGDIEKLETMVLALVIHTVPSVSAKVGEATFRSSSQKKWNAYVCTLILCCCYVYARYAEVLIGRFPFQ